MKIKLAYGKEGLYVDIPGEPDILYPQYVPGVPDEDEAIRAALSHPIGSPALRDLVNPEQRVIVVHSDITRATPNTRLLPVLLTELERAGVGSDRITLLNGTGTHRQQSEAEMRALLGKPVVERYHYLQHDAWDPDGLVDLGTSSFGHPVTINRDYWEADFRIVTGFIEPHFFAGFSGGPKGVMPGVAGGRTVLANHGKEMIAHPKATWGITSGNPIWEEMREVALKARPDFLLNVTLNADHQMTGVFAGDMLAAHQAGCEYLKRTVMVKVDQPYDIVITTNSGYPLDQNLYQAVKGISAARQIVRKGGSIIIAAACEDGLPAFGQYAGLLAQREDPTSMLEMIWSQASTIPDQWQVQIQALIQQHAQVYVYSDGLSDEQIRKAMFIPTRDIPGLLAQLKFRYGADARVCVLPEGPQTVAYV